jgi:hypothetical protein
MPFRTLLECYAHQNFHASKGIVPLLTIAIESTLSEDLDVLTTPHPESDRSLERVVEVVCLPVVDIVGELLMSGQFNQSQSWAIYLHFTLQLYLDIIQEAEIELLANDIGLPLLQEKSAAVVGGLDSPKEVIRNIIGVALR